MNILTVVPHRAYMSRVVKDVRDAYSSEHNNMICYVTLNRPHKSVVASLDDGETVMERFFFVDAITKTVVDNPEMVNNCSFVSSPSSFDEMLTTVEKIIENKEFGAVVFDSVCTLFSYAHPEVVLKFLRKLAIAVDIADCEGVFVAIKPNIRQEIIDRLDVVADKVIYMDND